VSEAVGTDIVEALSPVPGKKTCAVQVDGESFEVAQSVVESLGLTLGSTLTGLQKHALQTAARKRAAAASALRYLQGRPRTAREVARHLDDKGHDPEAVQAVLADLQTQGVVDDRRFAAWYVEARLGHRPTGRVRLVQEMTERGIERGIAEGATETQLDEDTEWRLARRAAARRHASLRGLPPDKAKRRLASFLAGRGFPMEIVRRLCLEEFDGLRDDREAAGE
jgi:regulatory protein